MDKTTVYLDEETLRALRGLARATGRSQATLIREAIRDYSTRVRRPDLGGFIGCVRSERADLARRSKEALREMVAAGELDDR